MPTNFTGEHPDQKYNFSERFNGYGVDGSVSSSMSTDTSAKLYAGMLRHIDSSFPSQGTVQPAHLGSQSTSPDKSEP